MACRPLNQIIGRGLVMKIVRFEWDGGVAYGVVDGEAILKVDGLLSDDVRVGARMCDVGSVRLLPPAWPRTVVGIGANYHSVVQAVGMEVPSEPGVFLKAASCVIGHLDDITHPTISDDVRFEAELAVVMKKEARHVGEGEALDYVLGYTCANDLTAHDIQDRFPTRNKSFYTSCPLGPCLVTDLDPSELRIKARLNGTQTQDTPTSDMVFSVSQLISYVTEFMLLEPLDVILTGTSARGVKISAGDTIEIDIRGIGVLSNSVI
jgi:2-keto-4-pentenoate hydratase/2-oxohepta-3-ene-1,7-dioic acid hydratase in catechol pathway